MRANYGSDPTYSTKHGTPISPLVPAQIRGEKHARYRLCQILPAVPQRFEWIHVYNIVVHKDGLSRPLEEPAQTAYPKENLPS